MSSKPADREEVAATRIALAIRLAFTEGYRAGFINDGGSDEHGAWMASEARTRNAPTPEQPKSKVPVPGRSWLELEILSDGRVELHARCITCGGRECWTVPGIDVAGWVAGALIQNALPQIPENEREILISGECSKCFEAMFAGDSDD